MTEPETDPEPIVRRASAADAAALAALGARTFHETFADSHDAGHMAVYLAEAFAPARIAAEIADPAVVYLAAWLAGGRQGEPAEAVGYAKLETGEPPGCVGGPRPIELVRLYVDAALHGRGVAAALMAACFEGARRLGRETIWLGVWDRNPRARRFYEKWGFREVGVKPFQFAGEMMEDLVMERPVGEARPA